MEDTMDRPMPRYQCHKKVWALKIKEAEPSGDGLLLTFEDEGFAPRLMPASFIDRVHGAGGYLVQYEDGYFSWSPTGVFEEGYTRI